MACHYYLSCSEKYYISCKNVDFFLYRFLSLNDFLWTEIENLMECWFFGMESSKLINYSREMCWSCPCIYEVVQLFSGIYSKLIKVLVHKKVTGEIFEVWIFCANVHKGNVKRAPSRPILGHVQIVKCQHD